MRPDERRSPGALPPGAPSADRRPGESTEPHGTSQGLLFDDQAPKKPEPPVTRPGQFALKRPEGHQTTTEARLRSSAKPVDDIQAAFEEFHALNPHVYDELVEIVRDLVSRGLKPGVGMVWEVLRCQGMIETNSDDGYKLNNNHRSRYARLIARQEPDLADVFELRELKSV